MPGRQKIGFDKSYRVGLAASEKMSSCLGADDAAGVWLLCEMIRAGIPGLYVFHRNEERGGRGAEFFAKHKVCADPGGEHRPRP
jgi:hypothetical protein